MLNTLRGILSTGESVWREKQKHSPLPAPNYKALYIPGHARVLQKYKMVFIILKELLMEDKSQVKQQSTLTDTFTVKLLQKYRAEKPKSQLKGAVCLQGGDKGGDADIRNGSLLFIFLMFLLKTSSSIVEKLLFIYYICIIFIYT